MLDEQHAPSCLEFADIEWAFRLLLGREPENHPDTLRGWRKMAPDIKGLVSLVAGSAEFMRRVNPPPYYGYMADVPTQDVLLSILRRLAPFAVDGVPRVRVGSDWDGGYVMLDDFDGVRRAYSLGISTDVAWDAAIADRAIDVYQYDHTIDALPYERDRFHWKRIGIEGRATADPRLDTLENQIIANGHGWDRNMVLKCDIEGAEWSMLAEMGDTLARFRQIVIELHSLENLYDRRFAPLVAVAVANLTRAHKVVHVHGNNCAPYAIVGGIPLPSVLELTLVRADDSKVFCPSNENFPTDLDMPNLQGQADYRLGTFRF